MTAAARDGTGAPPGAAKGADADLAAMTDAFRLDRRALLDEVPADVDPGAMAAAARSLLDERGLGWEGVTSQAQRAHLLQAVAGRLLARGRLAEALHLGRHAGPEWVGLPGLAQARTLALLRTHDFAGLEDEVRATMSLDSPPEGTAERLSQTVRSPLVAQAFRRPADLHERAWGPVPESLDAMLARVASGLHPPFEVAPRDIELILALREGRGGSREEFEERHRRGTAIRHYVNYLSVTARRLGRDPSGAPPEVAARLLALQEEVERRSGFAGLEAVLDSQSRGRSVLLAFAHTGWLSRYIRIGGHLDLRLAMVAAGPAPQEEDDEGLLRFVVGAPDLARRMAAFAKTLSRSPSALLISPDAAVGESRRHPFMGRTVALSRGAARLGYRMRADSYFLQQDIGGGRFTTTIAAGPRAADWDDADGFEAAFEAFYLDRLREVVLGPPEVIGELGRFLLR